MLRKSLPLLLLALSACNSTGGLKVPFTQEKAFTPTPVPADFAVIIDENHDTYYSRQHIRQRVTADDHLSQTTYTTRRDYNNSVSNDFSQETPLSNVQLQNMWNDVARYNLMAGSSHWITWRSDADLYKRNSYTLQIRANGQTRTYTATNGFSGNIRPLILQTDAVRLPISQQSNTPVLPPKPAPTAHPSMPEATSQPALQDTPAAPRNLSAGLSDGVTVTPTTLPAAAAPNNTPTITIDRAKPPASPATPTTAPADDSNGYHQLKIPARSSLDHSRDPLTLPDPTPTVITNNNSGWYSGVMIPVANVAGGDRQ